MGVNPWFWSKSGHFSNFFFWQYRPRKCLLRYSRTKKGFFQAIKTRSSKTQTIDIFPQGLIHGFGPKTAIFPTFFFQAIQARQMSFTIFQNEKTPFQAKKIKKFKKSKKLHFFKGDNPWFDPKVAIFPSFFFEAIQARKMSFTIFQNKKSPFQAIKTRSSKSGKIDIFLKGLTLGFGPKMAVFANSCFFFFRQYRPGNCLLQYSRTKKRLSRL